MYNKIKCNKLANWYNKEGFSFKKKVIEHKMRVLIFPTTLSETFFTLKIIQRDMIKNVYRSALREPVILVRLH